MADYVERSGLRVDSQLAGFVEGEVLPGLPISAQSFWSGFAALAEEAGPRNRALLDRRDVLQKEIDDWHHEHGPVSSDPAGYVAFLKKIGYLVPEPQDFTIETSGLDPEVATLYGPQLVVPVSNARYALNAANARWGSLFDALYGTDAIDRAGDLAPTNGYNPARGAAVFARAAEFLDEAFPLTLGSHASALGYRVVQRNNRAELAIDTEAGETGLSNPSAFVGYAKRGAAEVILLQHNGLHAELLIDRAHAVGRSHPAGLADVVLECALTTIQDCEDSVAAVDAEDKVGVYRNWLGLMNGTLSDTFQKGGRQVTRTLHSDRTYTGADNTPVTLKGRSLLLVRNVGHLMTTKIVLDAAGNPIGEGLMDAVLTVLCAMHDAGNSRTGAIYIVKPKMHGPEEVAFACAIFAAVEDMLGLPRNTVKIGIMDEERRTSANLKACIFEARERVFFINTGFLDRTGDEIHTSMEAGPVLSKDQIKAERWIAAYEDRNVLIGLAAGFAGRAQIGKGMWARPDDMAEMLRVKIGHPESGANTAWVPSPTAATLHALHYHAVDVAAAQRRRHNQPVPPLEDLFSMPVLEAGSLSREQIVRELDNNAQGILGYVVRWVDQGVGCSKVPDINNVGLMEDRATCRISSQAVANWLRHGIVTLAEVDAALARMAEVVDGQNADDPFYRSLASRAEPNLPLQAARALITSGMAQPNGYTEPLLHAFRAQAKE